MRLFLGHLGVLVLLLATAIGSIVAARYLFSHELPAQHVGWGGFRSTPGIDVVFVGSSQTRQGIDPVAFEERGCEPYVLAYNGLSPVYSRAVIRASIREQAPAIWLVEAGPFFLLRRPSLQDTRLYLQLPPDGKSEILAAVNADPDSGWQDLATLLLRSDNELIFTYPFVKRALERVSYRGGTAGWRKGSIDSARFQGLELPADIAILDEARVQPDSHQEQAVIDIIEMVRESGGRVLFLEMPMPAPIQKHPLTRRASALFKDLVTNHGAEHIRGSDFMNIGDPANFSDPTHLSSRGRTALSRELAARVGPLCRSHRSAPEAQSS